MNPIFADLPTSVFELMSRLARETGAVNLGQGFPDDPGPEDVRHKAAEAVIAGWNQYPPMMGFPELRKTIAAHYRHWQGLNLNPDTEVMVTSGATEALAGALLALVEPGDEVVLFEPMYDAYFEGLRTDLQRSRDRFTEGLKDLGLTVLPSAATYFLNIDIGPLGESDDTAFCHKLVLDHGVAAIPVSAFYAAGAVRNLVRFCFAKRDATLDAALERLASVVRKPRSFVRHERA